MIELILFTLNIVSPIFLLIVLGIILKKTGLVTEAFVSQSSNFVFKISLPALIFLKIGTITINKAFDGKLILVSVLLVTVFSIYSWILANFLTPEPTEKGVFAQGSFRSNFAIIGLALISNLLGEEQLGKASLLLAFIMPLYNILAVIFLTLPFNNEGKFNFVKLTTDIIGNPLIIAALLALPFSIFHIGFGQILTTTLIYLAKIALPLALIGIGASLNFGKLKEASKLSFIASFNKILLFPVIATATGIFLRFDPVQLGILFILFASPTAIASFIMADAMGSNSKLAGDIIVVSTLFSILTLSGGIILLKYFSFI